MKKNKVELVCSQVAFIRYFSKTDAKSNRFDAGIYFFMSDGTVQPGGRDKKEMTLLYDNLCQNPAESLVSPFVMVTSKKIINLDFVHAIKGHKGDTGICIEGLTSPVLLKSKVSRKKFWNKVVSGLGSLADITAAKIRGIGEESPVVSDDPKIFSDLLEIGHNLLEQISSVLNSSLVDSENYQEVASLAELRSILLLFSGYSRRDIMDGNFPSDFLKHICSRLLEVITVEDLSDRLLLALSGFQRLPEDDKSFCFG